MSNTGSWEVVFFTDKNLHPITGRQLEVGDRVLFAGPDGANEVELTGQVTYGVDTIGFHCQAINKEKS